MKVAKSSEPGGQVGNVVGFRDFLASLQLVYLIVWSGAPHVADVGIQGVDRCAFQYRSLQKVEG